MVTLWFQQLKPEWYYLVQKSCRRILWGRPGHHAPGYFLTTRGDPRGQEMKPQGKAAAVKSAKVEYCAKGKGAGYFQKGASIFFLA